jgi:hypothetical protein
VKQKAHNSGCCRVFPQSSAEANLLSQSFDTADLSLDTAQRETEEFLTLQLPSTLYAVEYEMPLFSEEANRQTLGHGSAARGPE